MRRRFGLDDGTHKNFGKCLVNRYQIPSFCMVVERELKHRKLKKSKANIYSDFYMAGVSHAKYKPQKKNTSKKIAWYCTK